MTYLFKKRQTLALSALGATAIVALTLSACSSTGDAGETTGGTADIERAQEQVAFYSQPMTELNLPPLEATPEPGKKIVVVTNNSPAAVAMNENAVKAAETLGWTAVPIIYDAAAATGLTDAFAQAVAENPDGVITNSLEATDYAAASKVFAETGVPVVTSNTTDEISAPIVANVAPASHLGTAGRAAAAYIVANEGPEASVAVFNVPSFPVLGVFEKDFEDEFKTLCPTCHYEAHAVQVGDLGTKVPSQVVSAVQRDPSINYVVMGFADVSTGVSGALSGAGFNDVKIVGVAPSLDTVTAVAEGTQDMWVALPLQAMGWKSVDALARYFNGEDVSVSTSELPVQIVTSENVSEPPAIPDVVDTEEQFRKLWLLN